MNDPTDDLRSRLPLSPPVFHILLSLAGGQLHGYAILKEIARSTEGRVEPSTGTLYAAVKRLLEDGFIEESDDRPGDALDDERRRYYRLTDRGRELARLESQRHVDLAALARERKLLG